MQNHIGTVAKIVTAISVMTFATVTSAQTIEERYAAAKQLAEEGIRFLSNGLAKAQVDAEALRASRPSKTAPSPEAVKVVREKQSYAARRELAPWLFDKDGLPNAKGREFFENKGGRDRALAASRLHGIRPKVNPERLLGHRSTHSNAMPALAVEGPADGGEAPLYLTQWFYDAQQNRTWFELLLVNAPLNEWWEVYHAPSLQPTAWRLARLGAPDGVSGDVQQFFVAVPGQPDQAYFQIFLNQDIDYDGIPDGYEVAILKTDPENPDSNANAVADGDEDTDSDGLSNEYELRLGTNPMLGASSTDSDGDGLADWLESYITFWTGVMNPNPWDDADGDGLSNLDELHAVLDPTLPDYLLFNPPLAEHQRFVNDSVDPRLIVDASYPLVAGS